MAAPEQEQRRLAHRAHTPSTTASEQIIEFLVSSTGNVRLEPFQTGDCLIIYAKDTGQYVRPAVKALNPKCQFPDKPPEQETDEPTDPAPDDDPPSTRGRGRASSGGGRDLLYR